MVIAAALVRLVQRVTPASAGAALVLLPLAWAYQHPDGPAAWWRPSADMLMSMVLIEFLLIHGFPFLVFAASLVRVADGRKRVAFGVALGALILLYGAFAWSAGGGWPGVVGLAWLAAPNVLAFLHRATPGRCVSRRSGGGRFGSSPSSASRCSWTIAR